MHFGLRQTSQGKIPWKISLLNEQLYNCLQARGPTSEVHSPTSGGWKLLLSIPTYNLLLVVIPNKICWTKTVFLEKKNVFDDVKVGRKYPP